MEEWRVVPQCHKYEVSNLGRVRHRKFQRILKTPLQKGYPRVCFLIGGVRKAFRVHILVMRAFKGRPPKGYIIDHINRDPSDCRLKNLHYVTYSENSLNTLRTDLGKGREVRKAEQRQEYHSLLKEIRQELVKGQLNQAQIARKYNLHYSTVSRWVHKNRRREIFS